MVSIIDNNKNIYEIKELSVKNGYTHCSVCLDETYNYIMLKEEIYCPKCAIEYLIEPYCICGNYLRSEQELEAGICNSCK